MRRWLIALALSLLAVTTLAQAPVPKPGLAVAIFAGGWTLSATETEFLVEASLKTFDGGKPFFAKSWLERIPRNGV